MRVKEQKSPFSGMKKFITDYVDIKGLAKKHNEEINICQQM